MHDNCICVNDKYYYVFLIISHSRYQSAEAIEHLPGDSQLSQLHCTEVGFIRSYTHLATNLNGHKSNLCWYCVHYYLQEV